MDDYIPLHKASKRMERAIAQFDSWHNDGEGEPPTVNEFHEALEDLFAAFFRKEHALRKLYDEGRYDGWSEGYQDGFEDGMNNAQMGIEKEGKDLKDEVDWLNAELHGAELEVKAVEAARTPWLSATAARCIEEMDAALDAEDHQALVEYASELIGLLREWLGGDAE